MPTLLALLDIAARLASGCALFFVKNDLRHYLRTHYGDHTFQNLYHWQLFSFDTLLLTPYFLVMIVLSVYGLHRYTLVWLYYRNRKNATHQPASRFEQLPRVTIQLPIFNEQFVIDRLIDSVCRIDYPRELLEIQVLDDSTDETQQVTQLIVDRYRALGYPIVYLHRTNRHGFKAGALDEGLKTASGEFIAIFDADFVPPSDWLMRVIHHFAESNIGMVQTRWTHLNRDYSFLTQVEAILLDGHFVLEHGARSRSNVFFNFNGTAGMWRRSGHRPGGRLAARHPHRRYRPELPRSDRRLEIQIPPGCRMPRRASHRNDRLQNPAAALGQGPHPDLKKNPSPRLPLQRYLSAPKSKPGITSRPTSAIRSWSSSPSFLCPP